MIKSEGAAAAGSQHAERGLGWKMGGNNEYQSDMDAMFDNVRYVKVQGYFKEESLTYKCMTFTKPIHLETEKYIQKKWQGN